MASCYTICSTRETLENMKSVRMFLPLDVRSTACRHPALACSLEASRACQGVSYHIIRLLGLLDCENRNGGREWESRSSRHPLRVPGPQASRIYESSGREQLTWLQDLQRSSECLQGLLNAVVFGLSYEVRTELYCAFFRSAPPDTADASVGVALGNSTDGDSCATPGNETQHLLAQKPKLPRQDTAVFLPGSIVDNVSP